MRVADRVAYLGRDYEDGIDAGLIESKQLPPEIRAALGTTNSEIIGTLVQDIVKSSWGKDQIEFSEDVFERYKALYEFNRDNIYLKPILTEQRRRIERVMEGLYEEFQYVLTKTKRGSRYRREFKENPHHSIFLSFLDDMEYVSSILQARILVDYLAGMTDNYASRAFADLFLVTSPV